jgi:transposase
VQVGEVEDQHIKMELGLPGVRVVEQRTTAGGIAVVVERRAAGAACPGCRRWTVKCHDRRRRSKADEPLGERPVTLVLVRRRFRCLPCGAVFTEPDEICGWRRRLTRRLRDRLGREGCRQPVAAVATTYAVSPATVRRAVTDHATARQAAQPLPSVRRLGLDDFSLRRGRRYATGLHDLDRRRLIDVVEGRTSAAVQPALKRLAAPEQVEVVSMDMAQAYRAAAQLVLPQAAITVDKFHVVARVQDALAAVCRRVSTGLSRSDPGRQAARLVLRNREHLDASAWDRLAPVLRQHPDLRRAWLLKEDFRRWYRTATAATARLELRAWLGMVADAARLPEFQALTGMFREWGEEILNYFTSRVTQGPVEGQNHRAKVIQRQAYGYRNFANYRLRLLLAS